MNYNQKTSSKSSHMRTNSDCQKALSAKIRFVSANRIFNFAICFCRHQYRVFRKHSCCFTTTKACSTLLLFEYQLQQLERKDTVQLLFMLFTELLKSAQAIILNNKTIDVNLQHLPTLFLLQMFILPILTHLLKEEQKFRKCICSSY